jgi:hypothetical protein
MSTTPNDGRTSELPPTEPGGGDDFIDTSRWPIVDISFPARISADNLDRHFAAVPRLGERGEPYVAIVDLSALRIQNRELRQHVVQRLRSVRQTQDTDLILGVAHVCDYWLIRAALTVVLSLVPPPYPHQVFHQREEAERWVRTLLERHRP